MLCPQLPSELSDVRQPAALAHLKMRLRALFDEQTQNEIVPFMFNPQAACEEAEDMNPWSAERADFINSTGDDEIIVNPRGYTPPPTVGVIGSKPSRPLAPKATRPLAPKALHGPSSSAVRKVLLNMLVSGSSVASASTLSTPGRSSTSLSSAATPPLVTPEYGSPAKLQADLKDVENIIDSYQEPSIAV
ncbi:hypothetical protein AURDEDRAFT_123314 [Auricularia subglabra TFB-10046 SS5]|nr:hypothetical protein AURDEDRAFT_123314 [Auricularia subglabra TFB-10046 SS5]